MPIHTFSAVVMQFRRTFFMFGALAMSVSACRETAPNDASRFVHEANRACFATSESDRWSPKAAKDIAAVQVDPDAGFELGVAGSKEWLFLFDQKLGRVVVADSLNREIASFARPGHAPGEILPVRAPTQLMLKGRRADWIDVSGDTIAVLDGLTIHWYRPDGTLIRDGSRGLARMAKGALLPFSTKLRRFGSRDLVDIEPVRVDDRENVLPNDRMFSIWSVGDQDAEVVFQLRMAALPLRKSGFSASPFTGVDEAQALWDLHDQCLVVSDGGSPRLFVQRIGSEGVDTIDVPIPEGIERDGTEAEDLLSKMGSPGSVPEPSVRKRVRQMIVDPDGWVWLEPNHRASNLPDLEVLRVHVASGRTRIDTVPVFPKVFRPDGSFVGVQHVRETGATRILRVQGGER